MRIPAFLARPWAHAVLIAAAVAACYANSLSVPFLFDDDVNIVIHPCGEDLGCYLSQGRGMAGRVVGFVTFWLNRKLGGMDVLGFHLTNTAIHLAAALLVYALAIATLRAADRRRELTDGEIRGAALVAALGFACHPIQTQAVTYIVQRLASLATAFYLGGVVLYARSRVPGTGGRRAVALLAGAVAAAVLAMRTKEIAFTLPLVVALYELVFGTGPAWRRTVWITPLAATLPLVPLAWLHLDRPVAEVLADASAVTRVQTALGRWEYFATQCRVVVTYLRLLLFPAGQHIDWDFPASRSLAEPAVVVSATLLLALLGLGIWLLTRASAPELRVAGFGIAFFFLALSVESSFVPIVDVLVEHRLYLPSAGAFLAVAGGGLHAWRVAGPSGRRALAAGAAVWVVVLGAATVGRNRVWRSPLALWSDSVARSPGHPRARFNLGNALREAGDMAGAKREWAEATRLAPGYATAWNQLANVAYLEGDRHAAAERYRLALRGDPDMGEALYNLAWLLEEAGRAEEAYPLYRRFVDVAPPYLAPQVAEVRARFGWPAPPAR